MGELFLKRHADQVAKRITELGGKPNYKPEGLATRSHAEYREGDSLVDMIKEDLIAERIAIETYSEIVRWLGDSDPTTRRMIEGILRRRGGARRRSVQPSRQHEEEGEADSGKDLASPDLMLTIILVVLLIAFLAGGAGGYGRWGAAGMSPAVLVGLVLLMLLLTGRL